MPQAWASPAGATSQKRPWRARAPSPVGISDAPREREASWSAESQFRFGRQTGAFDPFEQFSLTPIPAPDHFLLDSSSRRPTMARSDGGTVLKAARFHWQKDDSGPTLCCSMSNVKKTGAKPAMQREFVVLNKLGIHARPAAMFVRVANRFTCSILVEKDGEKVNGKSIMGLMMLAAGPGCKIIVYCEGDDCQQALTEIEALIKRKFDED
jgi:phosphocarrier protein